MVDRKRKRMVQQQPDRWANRTILVRILLLLTPFGVAAFVPLLVRLWQIQIRDYDKYQGMAVEQQTAGSTMEANRGTTHDRSGETLAMSVTVYNIRLSSKEILACQEVYREKAANAVENGKILDYPEPTSEFIASNLAQLLDLDEADILSHLTKTGSMYEIMKWRVEDDERDVVISLINGNHITGIYTPPTTKCYYPKNSLVAQVIGFANPNVDNHGAYGIEAQYDDVLLGEMGRVVTARNGGGAQMFYRYEDYYDATDGDNLTLTLDSTIQFYCESILKKGIEQFEVQGGGFCIAMDPNTGEILVWANPPISDLNNSWMVSDPVFNQYLEDIRSGGYIKEEACQKVLAEGAPSEGARDKAIPAAETEVLYTQWANRSISSTYEPDPTLKFIVLAAALEEGVVTENSHFCCSGMAQADGWNGPPIKCSDWDGYGDQNLVKAVTNSCNPVFIKIGQALDVEKFYGYLENFGFPEKTGIDILGEQDYSNLIWPRDKFTGVDLAVASFGQRFQVAPIQLTIAAFAVINGDHLMQPYTVSQVTDGEGNVLQRDEPTGVRQTVSEQTSERCQIILEGVVNGGTGHNAAVEGHRIGGKIGSSQMVYSDDYTIVSFLGFAPADDPQVIILLVYSSPKPVFSGSNTATGGWYISGGSMAVIMVGELLEDILGHPGVGKTYTANADVLVPNLSGLNLVDAISTLQKNNLILRIVDDGGTVTGQIPAAEASIPGGSQVVLYTDEVVPTDQVQVFSAISLAAEQVRQKLADAGLYIWASGVVEYGLGMMACEQSTIAGVSVNRGTTTKIRFTDSTASSMGP